MLLIIAIVFNGCDLLNKTPKCSNKNVIETLTKLLNTKDRKVTINIDLIREVTYKNGIRICKTFMDSIYSVDKDIRWITALQKSFMESSEKNKNQQVNYRVMMNDIGNKFIVEFFK